MELGADDGNHLRRGRLMATVTSVYAIDYVAEILNDESGGAKVGHGSGGIMLLRAE